MRREHQMTLYLWLAGTAVAVMLMIIASLIGSISYLAKIGTILVASVVAVFCLGKALTLAWHDDEKTVSGFAHRGKVISLIGMIAFGVGFISCAAWYFWPKAQVETPVVAAKPP